MKKYFLPILLIIVSIFSSLAATYTPAQVPNAHAEDSTRYVSNPDGILSQAAESRINLILRNIRHTSTAEGVVVVLDDVEGTPADFATELFELWGLGKDDKDNGFLVLVVKDKRRAEIRTGYGIEGLLPDVVCTRIVRNYMAPDFRNGDYSAGTLAAMQAIESTLTTPEAVEEIRSGRIDEDRRIAQEDEDAPFTFYLYLCGILAAGMTVVFLIYLYRVRKMPLYQKYTVMNELRAPYLALTFLGLGFPLIATLPMLIIMQYWRNKPRRCTVCGKPMVKLDEETDNNYLSPGQDLEEKLGSVDYDVWQCPDDGEIQIEPYVSRTSPYRKCPRCGVYAYHLVSDKIETAPTTRRAGRGVRHYHCRACGYDHDDYYEIPRRQNTGAALAAGAAIGALGSRGGGGFGGGFGGGGFGGGHTGGGGGGGSW